MAKKHIFSLLSLIVFSANNFAEDTSNVHQDYSEIEAAERQYIIEELTYRLETKKNCKQIQKWSDKDSGADKDGYFFIPSVEDKFFMIGGYGTQSRKTSNCVIAVSEPPDNPENTPTLLVAPTDWKLIWTDKGSGAREDGSMWKAILPDSNYRCIGSIPQSGYEKPALSNYRCVHISLTEKIVTDSVIWSDKGSSADKEVTMFRLPNTHSFVAVKGRKEQIETYDLKVKAESTPDPKLVEEKLVARMENIRQDLGTELKEEAEQKRLAAEAEQKRLAAEAEQEPLTEEAEQEPLTEEAEQEPLTEEAEQEPLAEVLNKTEVAVTDNDKTITSTNDKKSTGITSFDIFLLKVFSLAIGLPILLLIIFRFIFKRIKK